MELNVIERNCVKLRGIEWNRKELELSGQIFA